MSGTDKIKQAAHAVGAHRISTRPSEHHVRVEADGEVLAESSRAMELDETGLPTRYYLPITDVRMELLRPSDLTTHCPYKGTANYWSIEVNGALRENLVWIYRTPLPESQKVAGLLAFYDEKLDVDLDGVRQPR